MKTTKMKGYEAPHAEVIEIENQGVLCASGGATTSTNAGGGTTNMNMGSSPYNW